MADPSTLFNEAVIGLATGLIGLLIGSHSRGKTAGAFESSVLTKLGAVEEQTKKIPDLATRGELHEHRIGVLERKEETRSDAELSGNRLPSRH